MVQNDTSRPNERGCTNGSKGSDDRGKHPSVGLPVLIDKARQTAPDGAHTIHIARVALIAGELEKAPRDVWRDRWNADKQKVADP